MASRRVERLLLDRVPALVAYWDRDERCRYANSGYAHIFDLDPERVLGMSIAEVLGPELYAESRPHLDAVFAGCAQHFDRTVVTDDGRQVFTEVVYLPDIVDGEVVGLILQIHDVTDRVEALTAARRGAALHRALARSLPDSLVVAVDADLRVTLLDGPACGLFGVTAGTRSGHPLDDVLPDVAAELAARWDAVLAGQYVVWDQVVAGRTVALRAAPLVDADTADGAPPELFGAVVVGNDVTVERRRRTVAEAIARVAAATVEAADLDEVCQLVADETRQVFNAAHASVSRFGDGAVEVVALTPTMPGVEVGAVMPASDATAGGRVAGTGKPAVLHYDDASEAGRAAVQAGLRCGAAAPVHLKGRLWGAVSVGLLRPPRDEGALLASLSAFADVVALAISSTTAWHRLEDEATTDHLTGLANRRSFDVRLAEAAATARRAGSALGVVLFDLDGFKAVNDTDGHPAGDALLVRVAAAARRVVRGGELLARTGGDEFAVVVTGDLTATRAAAARIAAAVEEVAAASFGVAATVPGCDSADALVAAADADLYETKRRRHRIAQ